jgi:hypothetical protein
MFSIAHLREPEQNFVAEGDDGPVDRPFPSNVSQKRASLEDVSPDNRKRTNFLLAGLNAGQNLNKVTPQNNDDGYKFPHGLYTRVYLPSHQQEHFVRSSIDWRWKHNEGIQLDKELYKAVHDDLSKPK